MIEEISNGNLDFIKKMIAMFITTMPVSIAEMKDHLENSNWPALGAVAHKIKPTIDTMGIATLKDDIRTIESYGKESKNLDELPALVSHVEHVIDAVIQDMKLKFS